MRYFNNFDALMKLILSMMGGFGNTLLIFCFTLIFSLPLGLALALLRMSKRRIISAPISLYILVMRGTPLMLQIFAIYFAIPTLTGVNLDRMNATILSFSLNYAAYFAEIFRGGIQAIDKGQMEAGRSLGMSWWQTMRYIILPQAFKQIIPPLGNEFIAMLKDSSLVSVIGFEELTRSGQLIIAETYGTLEIWTCVAIIYLTLTLTISRFVAALEKRFRKSDDR